MRRAAHLPALDGLRGLAILLVIAHNVQLLEAPDMSAATKVVYTLLDMGWVGVQLFFVLSGFLITGILLDTVGHPHALLHFIVRRALRIFPLYYGVLLLLFVLLPLLDAQPQRYQADAPHQLWLWTYLSNWTAPLGMGPHSLPHFWSLAVEEQFYLVWPLLVYSLRTPLAVARASLLVAVCGLLCRVAMLQAGMSTDAVYSWTICRIDALALGGLAAACWRIPAWAEWVQANAKALLLGTVVMLTLTVLYNRGFPRTSPRGMTLGYSVLALVFGALIYAAANQDSQAQPDVKPSRWWQRLMHWPALRSVGQYSYGMYVFHKPLHDLFSAPVLASLGVHTEGHIALASLHVAGLSLVSYMVAWVSYHLVEQHFLRLKRYVG